MSKYLTIFNTESQWQAAQDSLDYPNVSLIDETGELHYSKYTGQNVVDAPFGSILMYDVATNKLFYIEDSANYNLTDYPFADYKPIAVCIYDKANNVNNEAVFMSVQWADYKALGTPNASKVGMTFGPLHYTGDSESESNTISSITLNNNAKPLVTKDYSGSSITDTYNNGESTALCSAWRFSTIGVPEGYWYIPSIHDLLKYRDNYDYINGIFSTIKTVAGSSYLKDVYADIWTANNAYRLTLYNNVPSFRSSNR